MWRPGRNAALTAILLGAIFAVCPAGPATSADTETHPGASTTEVLDTTHASASDGVRGLGAWLDRFFADEDYEAELNESRLLLRSDNFAEQYEGLSAKARARLYLKLPGLGERFRVEILSDSQEQDGGGGAAESGGTVFSALDDGDIAAALAFFFRNDENLSISARAGLTFADYTPDPYAGVRLRKLVPLSDTWNYRFTERVRYYSLEGFESITSFGIDHGLTEDRLFRTDLTGVWLQEGNLFNYSLGFSLFEPLDEKSVIEYQLIDSFRTDPHQLSDVTLRFRYRRQVWRDWFAIEVAPQVSLPETRDFEPVPGFFLRFEATLGG